MKLKVDSPTIIPYPDLVERIRQLELYIAELEAKLKEHGR